MTEIHIESIDEPFVDSPRLARLAVGLVTRAQVMGCIPEGVGPIIQLDGPLLEEVRTCFRAAGIGALPIVRLPDANEAEIEQMLDQIWPPSMPRLTRRVSGSQRGPISMTSSWLECWGSQAPL